MGPGIRRSSSLVAIAALALVLGACSSSSGSDAGGSAGASTTTAAGSPAVTGKVLARYADYHTKNYDVASHWVCRPDTPKDICHGDLDSTTIAADGTLTVQKFHADPNPPIDCFYVYPTISRDKTTFSDWDASPDEEGYVTLQQAARLRADCRVFAPVYRQATLSALTSRISGAAGKGPKVAGDPFADVLDAFRTYMAEDNHGRGFVLIGHSQGAGMLNQLIKQEIDPNGDVRAKLVAAYLAGGTIAVPKGKIVGGDFQHVPLCTEAAEHGCALSWSTFRSTATPPPNSYFGVVRNPTPGETASCVDPAAPGGGSVDADSEFPADSKASILSSLGQRRSGTTWLAGSAGDEVTTPFVSLPGLVSVQCQTKDGFHFLEATLHPSAGPRADDVPGDLTPEWGLHLIDVNLVMGDIVKLVAQQAKAYAG